MRSKSVEKRKYKILGHKSSVMNTFLICHMIQRHNYHRIWLLLTISSPNIFVNATLFLYFYQIKPYISLFWFYARKLNLDTIDPNFTFCFLTVLLDLSLLVFTLIYAPIIQKANLNDSSRYLDKTSIFWPSV